MNLEKHISARTVEWLHWALAGSLLLCFWLFFLAENGRINAFASYFTAIFLLILSCWKRVRRQFSLDVLSILTGALLLYLALSATWQSVEATDGFAKHLGYAGLIATFVLGIGLVKRRFHQRTTTFVWLVILAGTTSSIYSLTLHYLLPDYQPLPEPRLYSMGRLSNPVIGAVSYGFVAVLAAYLVLISRRRTQLLLLGVLAVLTWAIALSGTRTVWLALIISCAVGIYLSIPERSKTLIPVMIVIIVSIALATLGLDEFLRRSFSFRPEIWSHFITLTISDLGTLLLGAGSGTPTDWVTSVEVFKHPHSIFVSTFYFGGLIGLLLLLATYFLATKKVIQSKDPIAPLAAMLVVFGLIIGLLDGDNLLTKIDYLWWVFWLPIALCISLEDDDHQSV